MAIKHYRLYCEICGYKRITDGSDVGDLHELKVSNVPGGVPIINPQTKEKEDRPSRKPPKRFRCPNCGRVLIPKKVIVPILAEPGPDKKESMIDEPLPISLETPVESQPHQDKPA